MNKQFSLYTDGGARGNPGPAAIGGVILDAKDTVVKEFGRYLGETTNNQAEYKALLFGLEQVAKLVGTTKLNQVQLHTFLDSELVIKQLKGEYRVRNVDLQPLYAKIKKLVPSFGQVSFTHIRREKNRHADRLVNVVLDARGKRE